MFQRYVDNDDDNNNNNNNIIIIIIIILYSELTNPEMEDPEAIPITGPPTNYI